MEQEEDHSSRSAEEMNLESHSFVQTQGNILEGIRRDESELDSEQHPGMDEAEVHVLYLNVPASDEPQVLDLSNILINEGIQVIESSDHGDHIPGTAHIHTGGHDIVIGNDNVTENTSAEALLQLSSDQNTATYIMDESGTMIPISQMR